MPRKSKQRRKQQPTKEHVPIEAPPAEAAKLADVAAVEAAKLADVDHAERYARLKRKYRLLVKRLNKVQYDCDRLKRCAWNANIMWHGSDEESEEESVKWTHPWRSDPIGNSDTEGGVSDPDDDDDF